MSIDVLLELTDLSRTYDDGGGIHAISLRVPPEAIYALCGANGAGKTTTLAVIAGLLFARTGTLRLDGQTIPLDREVRRPGLGFLPDQPYVDLDLTPDQWVTFVLELKHVGAALNPHEAAEALRLTQRELGTPMRELSFGTRRKAMLWTELVTTERVLLLDEPLIGLDPPSIDGFRSIAQRFVASRRSIVMSTHLLAEAEAVATHVGFISHGRTTAEGTLQEIVGDTTLLSAFMRDLRA